MATIILAIALLIALVGLGVEIGIASWSIHRANGCRRGESAAERALSERRELSERMEILDEYASKISWLLNFLYKRYDKFADLEKEIDEARKGATGGALIGEIDDRYKDLKTALKVIRTTANAFERMGWPVESFAPYAEQILEDFYEAEEEEEKPAEGEDEKSSESKAPEAEASNS
jgi:hypothetical protein